ncbi:formyltetrahydrofolate deformylase [Kocuria rhizophila]|uniref:formyltetrahydrofolate deformylase n=1 Tax=Kocuria rhizophila TaxID=72000 RepID=UPI0007501F7F|nr:formyltetrahydrofolate deformylase [Kocuria rhizophila]MXN62397.1 formyltetrahydrofolate deformylase [Bacillus sp. BGMRC0062]KUP28274.1 formyltetrahydrofolate deformylase [Kocuria rhizophila]MBO4144293.1 formyltetrahydrofolate deformylase [Kocuria rhizophila]MDN3225890.1 formyltetrahydrofolate deformylase [Kocuria rhizophila]QTK31089.1 formyltetrahydrofolate deformylase [Kocuria rhizophila]
MSAQPSTPDEHVLTAHCPEAYGLVSAVASNLTSQGCDIFDVKHFSDRHDDRFFIRCHTISAPGTVTTESLIEGFRPVAQEHDMRFRLVDARKKTRVLVMVSKISHCLADLLHRAHVGSLPVEIVAVVSNHTDLRPLVDFYGVPFHHVPVTRDTKPQAEAELLRLVAAHNTELVVLARYMQILSDELTRELAGRCINIHHSFLPSFKGAKPYHQAYERGVKMVGATAHYVTPDLDEGPIIAQAVIPVNHAHTPADLVAVGSDAEAQTLSRAVKWHAEGRVVVSGNRTIVLA